MLRELFLVTLAVASVWCYPSYDSWYDYEVATEDPTEAERYQSYFVWNEDGETTEDPTEADHQPSHHDEETTEEPDSEAFAFKKSIFYDAALPSTITTALPDIETSPQNLVDVVFQKIGEYGEISLQSVLCFYYT